MLTIDLINAEIEHFESMAKWYEEMDQKEDSLYWAGAAMAANNHIASLRRVKLNLETNDRLGKGESK